MILVSPAERPPQLVALGPSSAATETYGVDFLVGSATRGLAGVQRKEFSDLIASMRDGRLSREVAMMQPLATRVVVVEGLHDQRWAIDGTLLTGHPTRNPISRMSLEMLFVSLQSRGIWVCHTSTVAETAEFIARFADWFAKSTHTSLDQRPGPSSAWGYVSDRDWSVHLMQSFPGIGPTVAGAIVDHFAGAPIAWTVDAKQMQQVDGVGKIRAERLIDALARPDAPADAELDATGGDQPDSKRTKKPRKTRSKKKADAA